MTEQDDRQISARPLVVPEIVTFPVDVDLTNALCLGTALIGAFGPGVTVVIADMTATEICDSSGLRYLVVANDVAAELGAELRVVARSRAVLHAMRTLGVDRVLRIYDSMSEALSSAPGPASQQMQSQ